MPKGGKIAPDERRSWLERYEKGTTVATIAKEAGRADRTVKDQLERARRERQHQQVQADLLRESYRDHHGQLLQLAERLGERCHTPRRDGLLGAAEIDERLLYRGLRSHTRGSEIWGEVKRWEDGARALGEESVQLEREANCMVSQEISDMPHVLADGFTQSLRDEGSMVAQGLEPEAKEYTAHPSGGTFQLRRGSFILADGLPDQRVLGETQEKHRGLLEQLLTSQTIGRLKSRWREWAGARDSLHEQLTILQLRKLLPGQCDLCPAGDTGARRPPRRRQNV